jgi:serine/threonine-protein phosphatase 6 regulatory ankyrin repeat subunit B
VAFKKRASSRNHPGRTTVLEECGRSGEAVPRRKSVHKVSEHRRRISMTVRRIPYVRLLSALPAIAALLVLTGCNVEDPLVRAAKDGRTNEVERLLKDGHKVDARGKNSDTALMWASFYGRKEIVERLLAAGADVNAKNENGWTSVMVASEQGYPDVVKILLDKGAEVNARESEGKTALGIAKRLGREDIEKLLVERGGRE